ncbi:MAG: glycoside hydrolase family 28 protein [Treponema sp.]|uniref:glycoside hydrolase family 28 protein n=1 Tax=Treponema sp. TaxID=166 RepID=UPI0025E602F4|nr:glycoside hydrolase family 28 protein [Treponema sp.]MBR0494651.1 glycoside hydrolase family 28 protein [Treponema sp.]
MTEINIKDFGAKNNGKFDNTKAFKAAFDELAKNGGGKLVVGEGVWLTGPIDLVDNATLELKEGAELSFISDPSVYPPAYTRWEGVECYAMHALLRASDCKNVTITGKGTINGNGNDWWGIVKAKKAVGQSKPMATYELALAKLNPGFENQAGGGGGRETQFLRPCLVEFMNCQHVVFEGIQLKNSPFWTVHPLYSDDLTLKDLRIENPYSAPNTDGIDIDSCTNVKVLNCFVSVGDDGICLKSGSGPDGICVNKPTSNVTIKDCTVRFAHGGIVFGSETAAGIQHVLAENCDLSGTDRGIRIKSRRGRGGDLCDITLKNLVMNDTLCPIAMNMYYKCGINDVNSPLFSLEKQPVTSETPRIHDVKIIGCKGKNCKASAGFIVGLPEMPIDNLEIRDCEFSTDESSERSPMESDMFYGLPEVFVKSFRVRNAPGAKFENVKIEGPKETFIYE